MFVAGFTNGVVWHRDKSDSSALRDRANDMYIALLNIAIDLQRQKEFACDAELLDCIEETVRMALDKQKQ
jgi:hypothetical protein